MLLSFPIIILFLTQLGAVLALLLCEGGVLWNRRAILMVNEQYYFTVFSGRLSSLENSFGF